MFYEKCTMIAGLTLTLGAFSCTAATSAEDDGTVDGDGAVASAAEALNVYEIEPNNTAQSATAIAMKDDNFGSFPGGDSVDYWKLTLPTRMYVNLFLGNIPAGSDYDIQVFKSSNLGAAIWTGAKAGNADELVVGLDMAQGDYVVKVYPYSGPRGDVSYRLRYASTAVSRGWEWVNAGVPYCGAAKGGADGICGGTCVRTGSAANPLWDPYRSDCSGFVSWAWQLPAPGYTTATLPSSATAIAGPTLAPGDALLGGGHVVLFDSWQDKAAGKALLLHEPSCGLTAKAETATLSTVANSSSVTLWGINYTAYRRNMP